MESARTSIVCATILLCVWANPVPKPDGTELEILTLMSQDSKVCKFPPTEVLRHPTKAPYIYPCQKSLPAVDEFGEGVAGIRSYLDTSEDKVTFLCMGFYDLSLQICKSSVSPESLVNTTKQFNNLFNDDINGAEYCKQLQPYVHTVSDSEFTKNWITVLNENLEDKNTCESWCVHLKKGKVAVHPLCKIILWGRIRLQSTEQLSGEAVQGQGESTGVEEFASPQDQYTDAVDVPAYSTDLEAKDIEQPLQQYSALPIRDSEDVIPESAANERLSPIRGPTSSSLTHEEIKTMPISQQEHAVPIIQQDPIPVSNMSHGDVVKSTEAVDKNKSDVTELVISPKSDTNITKSSESVKSEVVPSVPVIPVKTPENNSTAVSATSSSTSVISQNISSSTSEASIIPDDLDLDKSLDNNANLETTNEEYNADMDTAGQIQPDEDDDDDSEIMPKENTRVSNTPAMHNYNGRSDFTDAEDSHFFVYFLAMVSVFIVGYVVFHNKQKILALLLEGRRNGRGSRRRPSTSSYRKLDSNLEEAISSSTPRTNPHVIY